jgi:hypothetical protein
MKQFILATFISFLYLSTSIAQNSTPNIFIDCQMRCHTRYLKEQITFVNYMRDRLQADIYILATRRRTGAGGSEVQLAFEGNNQFEGILDTITYFVDPNATESIERDQMVFELKKGLLGYIVQTDMVNNLKYSIDTDSVNTGQTDIIDPWNYWVFNIGGNGWVNGEQSYNSIDLSSRVNANRITDKHKFVFTARTSYAENTFKLTDGDDFKSTFISYNLYLEYVKSLGEHWSIGGVSRSGSSTFGNTDVRTSIKGALEYNFYPYTESQTRRFSFFYTIGPEYYDYTEPTIYEKETEWVARHGLNISYEQTQKWGNVSISLGTQQYFHNLSLYNAYLNPRIEWQIFKGLSFNLGGFFSFVTDRINIAKSEISDEDILLQIKQLDTDFTYHSFVGLNYRFGSKYNNFVNPRF